MIKANPMTPNQGHDNNEPNGHILNYIVDFSNPGVRRIIIKAIIVNSSVLLVKPIRLVFFKVVNLIEVGIKHQQIFILARNEVLLLMEICLY